MVLISAKIISHWGKKVPLRNKKLRNLKFRRAEFKKKYKFRKNTAKIVLMLFSSEIGSGNSLMAPWTPRIDIKFKTKKKIDIFSILDPWPAIIDHLRL